MKYGYESKLADIITFVLLLIVGLGWESRILLIMVIMAREGVFGAIYFWE